MGVSGLLSWLQANFKDSFDTQGQRQRGDGSPPNLLVDCNSLVHDACRHGGNEASVDIFGICLTRVAAITLCDSA